MDTKPLPPQAVLLKRLSYNPDTGVLLWLPRTGADFYPVGKQSADVRAQMWNTKHAGKPALASLMSKGYLQGLIDSVSYLQHRIIWKMMTGEEPERIDHRNGIRTDNRFRNLRNATPLINARNAKKRADNTSGHGGIDWRPDHGKWRARIGNGGRVHVGYFDTYEEAVAARKAATEGMGFTPRHGVGS